MDIDVEGEGVLGFKLSRIRIIISMISAFRIFFSFRIRFRSPLETHALSFLFRLIF